MHVPVSDVFVVSLIAGSVSTAAVVYNSAREKHKVVQLPRGLRHKANTLPAVDHPCSTCLGSSKIICTRCAGKGVLPTWYQRIFACWLPLCTGANPNLHDVSN